MTKRLLVLALAMTTSLSVMAHDNQLSAEEKAQGWQLLFNGKDMSHWRNFKKPGVSDQWQVEHGEMKLIGKGGGDILTKEKYQNFELTIDWKVSEAGNSGIFVMADESGKHIYSHAVEVQILDNERHYDNKVASHLSGSIYDLIASPPSSHKVAGEWNNVRILLKNKHLQVWQNQIKAIDVVIGGDDWQQLLSKSKFATWKGFGQTENGHIGLQDHGDPVSFRNIKIRTL